MAILLIAFVALALLSVVLSSVALGRPTSSKSPSTITVTGSGTVKGTPDTVSFQIGVSTAAASAADALSETNTRVRGLVASLRASGVAASDLQSSGLNIYANYNNRGNVTGFTASNNLDVTMHSINKAGAAIDAAARAAGNGVQLNGLSFSISNQSQLLKKARIAAMDNAYLEASQVAQAGGASVGSIVHITDQENVSSPPVFYKTSGSTAAGLGSVPIEAGSQSVNVQVTVVYSLK
ncbi:MAG: SIMPL domain-containing protein [Acidimicrobiaceae bacterium]|nr:SIMPL domain-containing protein [Acidimicrobiaceae bacterium]